MCLLVLLSTLAFGRANCCTLLVVVRWLEKHVSR